MWTPPGGRRVMGGCGWRRAWARAARRCLLLMIFSFIDSMSSALAPSSVILSLGDESGRYSGRGVVVLNGGFWRPSFPGAIMNFWFLRGIWRSADREMVDARSLSVAFAGSVNVYGDPWWWTVMSIVESFC